MDVSKAPDWFNAAISELGTHEQGDNQGEAIQRYCDLAHAGRQGDPWCAIFTNAMLEKTGHEGTRSASSQSFAHSQLFEKIKEPVLGCIVVFWRSRPDSGLGHVGFYRGEYDGMICVLGGNEGDMVQIEPFPIASASFGLVGYYWPINVDADQFQQGPILLSADTPKHVTDPNKVT